MAVGQVPPENVLLMPLFFMAGRTAALVYLGDGIPWRNKVATTTQ